MAGDLAAVHSELLRLAAANAAGDLEAAKEGSALLIELTEQCKNEDVRASERLLHFLLDVTSPPMPDAERIRALLCGCVLEVMPPVMQLAVASAGVAALAAILAKRLAAGLPGLPVTGPNCQAVCSPRELIMALLEVYDEHKGSAFDTPMHLLLLALLGLMPRLVSAVQRRRLQVALSCLPAVVDLAAEVGSRLAQCRRLAEAAAAGDGGGNRTEEHDAAAAAKPALEMWRDAEVQLVLPFVRFTEQLHELVLTTELPPLPPFNSASTTTVTTTTSNNNNNITAATNATASASTNATAAPSVPFLLETDRSRARVRVAAWLLAMCGALWPSFGPLATPDAGGAAAGSDCRCAMTSCGAAPLPLLNLLFGAYLGPLAARELQLPLPSQRQELRGTRCSSSGGGSGGGLGAAATADWQELWALVGVAAEDPDLEVTSDPELPRLGAATLLWLATTATVNTTAAAAAGQPQAAEEGADGRGRTRGSVRCLPLPELPSSDPIDALKLLLDACQVLLRHAGRDNSTVQLNRALQLLAAGSARVRCIVASSTATAATTATTGVEEIAPVAAVTGATAPVHGAGNVVVSSDVCNACLCQGAVMTSTSDAAGGRSAATLAATKVPATNDPWVNAARQIVDRSTAGPVLAADLYDMLAVYGPRLDERESVLEPLAQHLMTVAAVNVAHGSVRPEAEAARTLAHAAVQSLLGALPLPLRALCLDRLAAGPSPEVSALALQRLQREVAVAATAATATGAGSVFLTPWVLHPVLRQLLPLVEADGAADAAAAADTLAQRADGATAAVSVVRFLALRQQVTAATAAAAAKIANVHFRSAANGGMDITTDRPGQSAAAEYAVAATGAAAAIATSAPVPTAVAARTAVLTTVYNSAVRPLHGRISAALQELRLRVKLEEEEALLLPLSAGAVKGPAAVWGGPVAPAASTAAPVTAATGTVERFAGNVAMVSDAVAGLTAINRLQEVVDCLAELVLQPRENALVHNSNSV